MIPVIVAPSRSAVTPAASNANSYGQQAKPALQAAAEEIQRLDALFSISSEEGDILPLTNTARVRFPMIRLHCFRRR